MDPRKFLRMCAMGLDDEVTARDADAAPVAAEWDKFLALYQRRGLARLKLHSRILVGDIEAVRFSGHYVLHR